MLGIGDFKVLLDHELLETLQFPVKELSFEFVERVCLRNVTEPSLVKELVNLFFKFFIDKLEKVCNFLWTLLVGALYGLALFVLGHGVVEAFFSALYY